MSVSLAELLCREHRPRLLVVGDVMLDRYIWADGSRLSGDPSEVVLQASKREDRLGGAGIVAAMAAALGAEVSVAAVVGGDSAGRRVIRLLEKAHVDARAVFPMADRRTSVHHRFLSRSQGRSYHSLVRLERQESRPIDAATANQLLEAVWQRLDWADGILLSDYGKGVCVGGFVPQLVAIAQSAGVPVLVDPARSADYRRYAGCSCLLPNRLEAGLALGMRIATVEDGLRAAKGLLEFGVGSAAVKLDRDGIAWAQVGPHSQYFPTRPRQVYDGTGAGEMVLAALGFAIASGADWPTGLELANLAAGMEVCRLGCAPIHRAELRSELVRLAHPEASRAKILSMDLLFAELSYHRAKSRRIVLIEENFQWLDARYLDSLEFARSQGDLLIVAVHEGRNAHQWECPCQPCFPKPLRARMLAALACVDYVVVVEEASIRPVIERIRPDVVVQLQGHNPANAISGDWVASYGGRLLSAPAV
ncbi:MAG: PfkB family carbohydrate kinase [Thermoguttaceae bacterium]|nr:PfkB family carbohydrate kinase [Thermoguttaceae bacterium]MDW8039709.1 PfkB family carbohydrate kinase [Thermoguttaceae bacterium]